MSTAYDPELHTLRSIARSTDGRDRQELESARFNLFAALERGATHEARRWSRALRVALLAYEPGAGVDGEELRSAGLAALEVIESGLG